jgi:hypothetical protein
LGADLYLRGDESAVVRLRLEDLPLLGDKGLSWRELSRGSPRPLVLLLPGPNSPPVSTLDVLVLNEDREGAIVAADQNAASRAISRGFKAVPLDRTWPIRSSGFLDQQFVHEVITPDNGYIQLAGLVNPDTLESMIQWLEDYETRHSDTQQVLQAARWLRRRLEGFGYMDAFIQGVKLGKIQIASGNVVAKKTGSSKSEFRIIVGGHYDSTILSTWGSPLETAPGADDNASGTAGVLEVARLLAPTDLDATVEFVLFAAEEQGLYGSREYVAGLVSEGVPPDKAFCINMDMIGNEDTPPWEVRIFNDEASQPLGKLFATVTEAYTGLRPVLSRYSPYSDHASFVTAGYPALLIHEGDNYGPLHTPNDRLVNLEIDYAAEVVRAVLAATLHLARLTDPPSAVTASETGTGDLLVQWNHAVDADVIGYYVELLGMDGELVTRQFSTDNYATLDSRLVQGKSLLQVRAEDVLGESEPSESIMVGAGKLIVGATPNPTGNVCRFNIFIPGTGELVETALKIVDVSGRLVRSIRSEPLPRGSHTLQWDTTFSDGNHVPEGVYFYIAQVDGIGKDRGKIKVVR